MALPKSGKGNKSRDIKGNKNSPDAKVERLDEQMNPSQSVVDGSAQEVAKQDKPRSKKPTIAELTKRLEEANKKIKEQETLITEFNDSFFKRNQELAAAENLNKDILKGTKSLINRQKSLREKNDDLSKTNQDLRSQNSILTESIRQSTLKSPEEVAQAQKELESASEPKVDNSAKTEETATPESEAKTEQAQATQEPKKETTQTSIESSEITPEEVYNYLSDKNNFKDAEQYFASGKDAYVGINNERIPKSWFDAYKENKDKNHKKLIFNKNNKDVFTASLRDKGLLEDPNKAPDRAETERVKAETAAKEQFDKSIATMGNKLLGVMGRHPYITMALIGAVGAPKALQFINDFRESSRQQDIEDAKVSDSAFFGESDDNEDYNGSDPNNVTDDLSSAAQETEQTNNNVEEQAAQALQDNLPQDVVSSIKPSGFDNHIANNATNSVPPTTEQAPKQSKAAVVNNTPVTNVGSSGMVYPTDNPDMVTSRLVEEALSQAPQAGSDAYGGLYDQNFIDFWAKRNPNLAYGVSQGRKA